MPVVRTIVCLLAATLAISTARAADAADRQAVISASADAPLSIDAGRAIDETLVLRGRSARQQIVVTQRAADGFLEDVSDRAAYHVAPPGVIAVSATGLLTPLSDGDVELTAIGPDGEQASLFVRVEQSGFEAPLSFANQITPLFTKYGCNGGGCHGKSGGQNGFRLSLLGFEPSEDYEYIVREARGRRISVAAAEQSLLLQKSVGEVPHGGGARFDRDDPSYAVLRRWIGEGAQYGDPEYAKVESISVFPERRLLRRGARQQLIVTARYTDGSSGDVTHLANYESSDGDRAEVDALGLVATTEVAGDAAVMIRYQGQVAVFRATVPLGIEVDDLPPANNFIDELVFAKLRELGVPSSGSCDDATFFRRVTLDVAGRLPTPEEVAEFLDDDAPNKREAAIDRLLKSPDYAEYFAGVWSAILRNRRADADYQRGSYEFHRWLRDAFAANRPYDELVRGVVAASGEIDTHPPVVWYREVDTREEQVEDTAQLFLGMRIQCARCHHHPFEKWSRRDYYGFSAFFSQMGRKPGRAPDEVRVFHRRGDPSAANPKNGERLEPAGLGAAPPRLSAEDDPRHALVDWMAAPDNPFFARALVNRYTKRFLGRGLVEPEDDMRETNPATNPELLDALANRFVASGFDLQDLIRTICRSRAYQRAEAPNEHNATDTQSYSRFYPRRLPAEVLLDAIDEVTQTETRFPGAPVGTRAVQLPDVGFDSYFLDVFGRPAATSVCECEREDGSNLAQRLQMMNSIEVQTKLAADQGRAARLAGETDRPLKARIDEIYLAALGRPATDVEQEAVADYLTPRLDAADDDVRVAFEDVLWSVMNTKEFFYNH